MSFPHECPGCFRGEHDRHDQDHGRIPGLIGGTYCPCTGGCEAKPLPAILTVLSALKASG